MKVLMVTDKMQLGGAETHIATLVEALIAEGIKVTLLSGGGAFARRLAKRGAVCVFAPLDKRDPISYARSRRAMKREMAGADIVHTHTRYSSFLAKDVRGSSKYPPIVNTAHLDFPTFPFGPLSFFGDRTLAVSEDIKQHLIDNYSVPAERISLTRNSIDKRAFGGERREKKLIVHTSRIDKGRSKCAFMLTELAPRLLREFPDHRILIIGSGELMPRLRAKVRDTNRRLGFDGIILAGERNDVQNLLCYAEVFVGVSRAALEAMSFGIPTIIAGDTGYGGIVSENDFDALALGNFCARGYPAISSDALFRDISRLLNDKAARYLCSVYPRERVHRDYTPKVMANDAIEVYKALNTRPRVCLFGYFGFGNLGDEASLASAVRRLREYGITSISVLTRGGEGMEGLPVTAYDRDSPSEISEAIRRSDILLLTGGNLLQNETSTRSIIYYYSVMRHAKAAGKRIYMISSGVGAVSGAVGKSILRRSLLLSSSIGARTPADAKKIKSITGTEPLLMPDLCFLLKERRMRDNSTRFALIISNEVSLTKAELSAICRSRALSCEIVSLFPDSDRGSAKAFAEAGYTVHRPKNASELLDILEGCAFTVSARLHGAIFSVISHTPAYIVTGSVKCGALLSLLDLRAEQLGTAHVLHAYSPSAVIEKKEIGVTDSDFSKIISSLRADIDSAFGKLFGKGIKP